MNNIEEKLSVEEAIQLLPKDKEEIHVLLNPGTDILIGADWSRERDDILDLLKTSKQIMKGGKECIAMKHGLVVFNHDRYHFIESTIE